MIPVKTEYPLFNLILPSTNQKITFRPFIESERKSLMIAQEMGDPDTILAAIKGIVSGCCNGIDVESISIFDLEYIFLQLRARSINEIMKLTFKCTNPISDDGLNTCGSVMNVDVNLLEVKVENLKKDLKVSLSPIIGVKLRYPSLHILSSKHPKESREYLYDALVESVDYIWEGKNAENIYYVKDYSKEDVNAFLLSLMPAQFKKLEEFLEDLPVLRHTFQHQCKKCSHVHTITLEGYQDFFI